MHLTCSNRYIRYPIEMYQKSAVTQSYTVIVKFKLYVADYTTEISNLEYYLYLRTPEPDPINNPFDIIGAIKVYA